ncbi:MAG: ribonuclease H-like domain-containing protein [Lachnospiraceae bacterium]|nr:ribonuclease H-like domain-containing protein [Lachnospiraceae bacterium]
MRTKYEDIAFNPVSIPKDLLPTAAAIERILFLDIETTGISANNAIVYLIGAAYVEDGQFRLRQFFAEKPESERDILAAFISFASAYQAVLTFNGKRFDIPFLEKRMEVHGINSILNRLESVDLFHEISPLKDFLGLSNCKLTSIENLLGVEREDKINGRDLIRVYEQFVINQDAESEQAIYLHNADDIRGMLHCIHALIYPAFLKRIEDIRVLKAQAQAYTDVSGNIRRELFLELQLPYRLPAPVNANRDGCYLRIRHDTASLRVPLYEGELKYFYANWQDYYFLPEEDTALHKSVASFVENVYREKATRENCYTRKFSQYLREFEPLFEPYFRKSYRDEAIYFEITKERKTSRAELSRYAQHIVTHIVG